MAEGTGKFHMPDITLVDNIITEVKTVAVDWRKYANTIGIPKSERVKLSPAFKYQTERLD